MNQSDILTDIEWNIREPLIDAVHIENSIKHPLLEIWDVLDLQIIAQDQIVVDFGLGTYMYDFGRPITAKDLLYQAGAFYGTRIDSERARFLEIPQSSIPAALTTWVVPTVGDLMPRHRFGGFKMVDVGDTNIWTVQLY